MRDEEIGREKWWRRPYVRLSEDGEMVTQTENMEPPAGLQPAGTGGD